MSISTDGALVHEARYPENTRTMCCQLHRALFSRIETHALQNYIISLPVSTWYRDFVIGPLYLSTESNIHSFTAFNEAKAYRTIVIAVFIYVLIYLKYSIQKASITQVNKSRAAS